jgi:hypothetical protein
MGTGRPRPNTRNSPTRVRAARRRTKILELREQGYTHKEIAKKMGFSEGRSIVLVTQELDRLNALRTETADRVRRLELNRLDKMLKGIWRKARQGDLKSISTVLQIMERRARFQGIDLDTKSNGQPSTAKVTMNFTEVVVKRETREALTNGQENGDTTPANQTPPGPARLCQQPGEH